MTAPSVPLHLTGSLIVRRLGILDYQQCWQAMQQFTNQRTSDTPDELWLLQHFPVYTLGLNGKREHIHDVGDIPVVNCDRGGQVTYHGPGQLVCYVLVDLHRAGIGVKKLVWYLEQAVIDLLNCFDITGARRENAPGVYVDGAKIAALGLRIRRRCSYHGLSLNVNMDLSPFSHINPCGFENLKVTQLNNLGITDAMENIEEQLIMYLRQYLNQKA